MSGGLVMKTISRASNTPVLAHRSDDAAPRHATAPDLTKNSSDEKEPFSLPEFAAGSIAVAAVGLIAFLGIRGAATPNVSPANVSAANVSPANASKPSQSPAAAPDPWVEARQRLSQSLAAMARAMPNQSTDGVTIRKLESPGPDLGAGNPTASHPGGTKASPALDFLAEAAPSTRIEMRSADTGAALSPLIGPLDLVRPREAISVQSSKPVKEAAIPVSRESVREAAIPLPHEAERNPSNPADALWIQTKLHNLGYFAGNVIGIWGAASRNALRDFKTMNGLREDDKWDHETEKALLSRQNVPAASTFIGGWAQSVEECRRFHGGGAPLVMRSRGAQTEHVKCNFLSIKREMATAWRIEAACSADGQSWNSTVSLKLTGSNLSWSSENGQETYVRCVKP